MNNIDKTNGMNDHNGDISHAIKVGDGIVHISPAVDRCFLKELRENCILVFRNSTFTHQRNILVQCSL